jgi:hypothetical protein
VLAALREGQIDNAVNQFGQQFAFNDYGIGLEFRDKTRLTEFFQKTRELYPDSLLVADTFFARGDYVISEWTLRVTLIEPFYSGLSRKCQFACAAHLSCGWRTGKLANGRTTMTD